MTLETIQTLARQSKGATMYETHKEKMHRAEIEREARLKALIAYHHAMTGTKGSIYHLRQSSVR